MITNKNLSKKYGKKLVIDDLSFTVETGHVTGFLGPNGAGKSTTMRLMLGLDSGKGETLFDEKKFSELENPMRVVGSILDAKLFHPTRSAKNHLRMLASACNVSDLRIKEVLDQVGLTKEAKNKPGNFSLGMGQRLGLAAAMLAEPKYLILDEPANGLDPQGIAWLRDLLKSYAAKGRGVLVSSHLLSEISDLADRLVVIGQGKLISETTVSNFIGTSSKNAVFVRTDDKNALTKALKERKVKAEEQDGGLVIYDLSIEKIGDLAFEEKIRLHELSKRSATLEEAFLEATSESTEYIASEGKNK